MRRLCRLRDGVVFSTGYSKRESSSHSDKNSKETRRERKKKREKESENVSERNSTAREYLSHPWKKGVDEGVAIRNLSLLRRCNKNF